jgi:hypothetical protein
LLPGAIREEAPQALGRRRTARSSLRWTLRDHAMRSPRTAITSGQ